MNQQLLNLKRYYAALDNLRRDTRHLVSMEAYVGQGNMLVRTYTALHKGISAILEDPYLDALVLDLPVDATERQSAVQITILVGQLLAYVEGTYEYLEAQAAEKAKNDFIDDRGSSDEAMMKRFGDVVDDGS